jgi:photosystem II stability/assembly factor-like uncharacterized protein
MKSFNIFLFSLLIIINTNNSFAKQQKEIDNQESKDNIYSGLKFRSIGPALMSGRISDIVIHPENENIWYVTAGSGGVWKTVNSGTTWTPIFDNQKSYSIGCITLDPQNPNIIWVGTGENVGGRHVGYGDGIYKSDDGGLSWKNMGLLNSEHLSKIIIHPNNSNIIWVASQGPLWSKGGERGIYKSKDGGKSWKRTLGDDEWIGATDIIIDQNNSDILYAATWQRHRTVAGYLGGGPGSGIHKSVDGGETWKELTNGLPSSNMGKIGLTIAPQNTNIIYAAIELDRRTGGVYKSIDKGGSWKKMNDAVAGGTGPHYYQEIFASPHNFNEIYLVDNYMQVSYDGGKTFERMNESEKHVDNHAVAFKKSDPNYILIGCDGGLYESFDNTKNWKFIDNLPITQFYKIAVDDSEPFYYVYGGTQDNNTQGAPSQTDNIHGIRNSDWFVVLGGDGHQPATEPGNPNIIYAQWQQGNLNRHNRKTGENINIKPQPKLGEKSERFNWDAPILVSPHNPTTIYFGSQRLWKSEDRGDSWETISNDLTKNIQRIQTSFYGKKQKWDNAWDVRAMSNYSTITSISESPIKEGLIYIGTDDGLIQVTEDGGANWTKIDFNKISGLPNTAFVNDIKADRFDENSVYAVFDNHKFGDYNAYIFKSSNKGKTWRKISNNLPEKTLLWRFVQDHEDKDLMFLGTEFGVYFSNNGGEKWIKINNGLPNISVRDIAIQARENDLILGTFGRGIYILDDYSSLRNFKPSEIQKEAKLFKPSNTNWYFEKRILGGSKKASQGDNFFIAENPPFGVVFTYYLKEKYLSNKELRLKKEKENEEQNIDVEVPKWEVLENEKKQIEPFVWIFIYDEEKIIKKIKVTNNKGFCRANWDLKRESQNIISNKNSKNNTSGTIVKPGKYSAQLFKQINGIYSPISEKVNFKIQPLYKDLKNINTSIDYWEEVDILSNKCYNLSSNIKDLKNQIELLYIAYERAQLTNTEIQKSIVNLRDEILKLEFKMNGSNVRSEIGEKNEYPTLWTYLWSARGSSNSSYGPTQTHKSSLEYANLLFTKINEKYIVCKKSAENLITELDKLGAPQIKNILHNK